MGHLNYSDLDVKQIAKVFGVVLRRKRIERKFTQQKVGELADLQRKYVCALESGSQCPSLQTFLKICGALDIGSAELMKLIEDELVKQT